MLLAAFLLVSSGTLRIAENAYAASPVEFDPPPVAVPLDTDGDSLFEILEVSVSINVTVPDYYQVEARLYTSLTQWTSYANDANHSYRDVGLNVTVLRFSSLSICAFGLNGTFLMDVGVRNEVYPFVWLVSATYSLGNFSKQSFDSDSIAHLEGPCDDSGLDTDGDGLYEYLVIGAEVNVTSPGPYVLEGRIFGVMDNSSAPVRANADLGLGHQTIEVRFDGEILANAPVDGPYSVWLALKKGVTYELLSSEGYMTSEYSRSQFSPSVGALFGQRHNDAALDVNGDGASEYLAVFVNLTVKVPAIYNITGTMSMFVGFVDSCWNRTYLDVGRRNVTLLFSGEAIRGGEWNGTFWAALELLDENNVWIQTSAHITHVYSWIYFAKPPVAAVVAEPLADDGGMSYTLNASSSSVDARFYEVRWDFNGDGIWDTDWLSTLSIAHEFPKPGNYTVTLEVRDARGLTNRTTITIIIEPGKPSSWLVAEEYPIGIALAAILVVGFVALFFAWPIESLLIALLAIMVPLYTRLRRDDVLENYRRGMIHGFILAHPGVSFMEMKEALSISSGSLVYHLSVLQEKGQVCCRKSGTYMRYYLNGSTMSQILRLGLTDFQMEIVKLVYSKGEVSKQDIHKAFDTSRQTLHYNLKKLVTDGVLSSSLSKGHRVFRISSGAESDLSRALGLNGSSTASKDAFDSRTPEKSSSGSPES